MSTQTFSFFVAHNQYSHALPSIASVNGNEITFEFEKISNQTLINKLFAVTGYVQLTKEEAEEVYKAKYAFKEQNSSAIKSMFEREARRAELAAENMWS